ncbi:formate dehydrogenase subunit alpha [Brevibacillus agri]|uniref:Formate dehydrogenase subunit alpha n=1 Tax=Brevibacillus agri TaxID=51101 RepID=A0A3M8B460_9BACL|nr:MULTISPECIES: formate dehydrogenase subunit alpha [Brevibacillus]MBY0051394.1 formate dehydrogenase subunit alpha [Brevibacillus agri]MCG5249766.1 formate dehydrogenase subunit alpha [Brevibacillus agri]MDN4091897.1 formate dehydrogenase subunit alpha [Brevibacillus agri]QAV14540.1 formate dehydrogenase subunit alpha [Brevibacillus agri]QHZ57178.1 formate dehydrogenase subunit alpha [Brevibacillus sp. NSP2.1]
MKKVKFELNNVKHEAEEGTRILDYLLQHDIEHPHICYSPILGPVQTCDTCMCEVDGKIMRACSTPIADGMKILTSSERAKGAQTEAMDRILENHMLYCTVCDNNNGNCRVHNTAELLEIDHQTRPFRGKNYEVDMSHPFYRYDPDQCILCGRCTEVCQDLQVNETLTIDWEREIPRVIWDDNKSINDSSCVSCGQCVTVCPCNALMEKSMLGEAGFMSGIQKDLLNPMIDLIKEVEPGYSSIFAISEVEAAMRETRTKKTKTVCTFCGVGCSFEVWTKGRHILKVEPTEDSPVNSVSTCVKGKFGWDFVNSDQRLTTPLIRKDDAFVPATWDEALTLIAERMGAIKQTYGGEALGFVSSSKTTNEDAYLMQKLARQVFESNNIDNCSRYCQSPATDGLLATVGYGGDSGTIKDIASAGLVIIVGANPTEGHPVLATRVKRAKKLHGQKLIVSDLRKHEMAERSDLFLHPKQGTDFVWLTAVAKYIIDQGWHDEAYIRARVNQFDEYRAMLEKYTLDYAEAVTGLGKEQLIQTAKMIHEADGTCVLWGMGVTQNVAGSYTSAAISNLLLVTGNYGRPGAGAYPLRGHNNVQGACDMGTLPTWLPGYQHITDDAARAKFEKAYGVTISNKPGLTNIEMLEAVEKGELKAMYLMGEDMAWVDSNANHVHDTLSKLDFFVVQDVFLTKTAQFADVVLPASPSLEKDGTFANTERRIQRLYQVLEPLGDSKPDWAIIQMIAQRMGANWNYQHPSEIMDEIASLAPLYGGVSYDRLEGWNSLHWPVQKDGTDEPLLYQERFNFPDGKARLSLVEYIPPVEYPSEFDLTLNNGRLLEHFHEGNMTNKSKGIQYKLPEVFVEVSPELARERGVQDGSLVRLVSPYGAIKLRVLVTDRVSGNELYVPMHSVSHENAINLLTGSVGDVRTQTPAYKQTKVRMELLKEKGMTPLPMYNPRYAKRNPQLGVQVERKWAREDYVPIAEVNVAGGEK